MTTPAGGAGDGDRRARSEPRPRAARRAGRGRPRRRDALAARRGGRRGGAVHRGRSGSRQRRRPRRRGGAGPPDLRTWRARGRAARALADEPIARALLRRIDADPRLAWLLENNAAVAHERAGELAEAMRGHEAALGLAEVRTYEAMATQYNLGLLSGILYDRPRRADVRRGDRHGRATARSTSPDAAAVARGPGQAARFGRLGQAGPSVRGRGRSTPACRRRTPAVAPDRGAGGADRSGAARAPALALAAEAEARPPPAMTPGV